MLPAVPGYPPDANLFLAAAFNQKRFLEGDGDYEAALLNFATPDAPTPLGYADDNWLDGTQSGVFSFVSPGIVEAGYGLTTTMIHEYGHHSSMSHPHDGYDPASGVDFEPTGDFFFAWLGDESNSMMSYIDVNWDFSQFDRDNSARHHAGGYALIANRIAKDILRDRDSRKAAGDLAAADRELRRRPGRARGPRLHRHARARGEARTGTCARARREAGVAGQGAPAEHVDGAAGARTRLSGTRIEPSLIDLGAPPEPQAGAAVAVPSRPQRDAGSGPRRGEGRQRGGRHPDRGRDVRRVGRPPRPRPQPARAARRPVRARRDGGVPQRGAPPLLPRHDDGDHAGPVLVLQRA